MESFLTILLSRGRSLLAMVELYSTAGCQPYDGLSSRLSVLAKFVSSGLRSSRRMNLISPAELRKASGYGFDASDLTKSRCKARSVWRVTDLYLCQHNIRSRESSVQFV